MLRCSRTALLACAALLLTIAGCTPEAENEPDVSASEDNDDLHGAVNWSYNGDTGPDHWADLSPNYAECSASEQSPVNLTSAEPGEAPLQIDYAATNARLDSSGHVLTIDAASGTLSLGESTYDLVQLHFHAPSEHAVDGEPYAAEAHLVHANGAGGLAVVGVLIEEADDEDDANPFFSGLWERLPVEIDLNEMLPENRSSFSYRGSLTTPPCTEDVRWTVMQTPIALSEDQIERLEKYATGARPTQPIGERAITRTER
ncbi:MAG: carbonic anhydrase [Rhodothermales bacterium]